MDFELKTSAFATLAREKSDAAIVLVGAGFVAQKDPLSRWVAQAIQDKALDRVRAMVRMGVMTRTKIMAMVAGIRGSATSTGWIAAIITWRKSPE